MTLEYATPDTRPVRTHGWPLLRLGLLYGGVALPALGLMLNHEPSGFGVAVDWQTGTPLAWVSLIVLPGVGWPTYPPLLLGWVAMLMVCLTSAAWGHGWGVRVGLLAGVLMGVVYTLIVAAGLGDGEVSKAAGALGFQAAAGGAGLAHRAAGGRGGRRRRA